MTKPRKTAAEPRQWPADAVERWPIDRIHEAANNARTHSAEQVEQIAESMKRFGVTTPVLVDEEGILIFGHGRRAAAALLGLTELPVSIARGWTQDEKDAYRIADNQIPQLANWDMPVLKTELLRLNSAGFDMPLLGFPKTQLVQFMANPESVDLDEDQPAPPKEPVTKPGDLYQLGNHRLLCGDATSAEDVARLLDGAEPHLLVSDPPYGVNYDPDWRNHAECFGSKTVKMGSGGKALGTVRNDTRTDWRDAWALFPGDVAYVWSAPGELSIQSGLALENSGFDLRQQLIWAKDHLVIGRGHYHYQHESVWYAVRSGAKGYWSGDRKQTSLWQIQHRKSETGHSTQKPIECMRRPIENNSKPGDAVYDPFCGSGTTIIAAEMTARRCYGMEIDPGYCDVIVARWEKLSGKTAVRVDR